MNATINCPFCKGSAVQENVPVGHQISCEQCGNFLFTGTARSTFPSIDERLRRKIGFWTRDQNSLGEIPTVTSNAAEFVAKIPDLSVMQRTERLLRFAIDQQQDLGGRFKLQSHGVVGFTHSQSEADVIALARLLNENGWIHDGFMGGIGQVSPKGFMHASDVRTPQSKQAFIAMWFDNSMDRTRTDGLEPAIRNAGYLPIVVSGVEHINKIDDEIVSQIRRSRFLVADFTGHRGGVYFEAGFAMGLGLPVFWTCKKDHLADLHFDVRQYNCIDWVDPEDLSVRLQRRIEAVIGRV